MWGAGWNLNSFGSISSEKKVESGEAFYEYHLTLPTGASGRLAPYGDEYNSTNDPSVPDWNGENVTIQEYKLKNNPYIIIKQYKTTKGTIPNYPETGEDLTIYDDIKWYAQSPSFDQFYFTHATYHRVPITAFSGGGQAYDVPGTITLYFKEYDQWQVKTFIPRGITDNQVSVSYSDELGYTGTEIGYVNAQREQFQDLLDLCNSYFPSNDCGNMSSFLMKDSSIPWDTLGHTDFITSSHIVSINQDDLPSGSERLAFLGYNREDLRWHADLRLEPFTLYCKANQSHCSEINYGVDPVPYLYMYGYPSSPWGAYRQINTFKPFTTYVIKGTVEVDPQGWTEEYEECNPGDLELTQYSNSEPSPGEGFYALIKVGSFAVDETHEFNAEDAFTKTSRLHSSKGVWYAADDWDDTHNCWGVDGICTDEYAGIIDNLDSYLVNCWTLNDRGSYTQSFEYTFTTANETSRVVYISAYNPKEEEIFLKLRTFEIHIKPATYLVTGIDYEGKPGSPKIFKSYNLFYDNDTDKDGQPNLISIQRVGYLINESGQDSLPPTNFSYLSGRFMTNILLPSGGNITWQNESGYLLTETYTKKDPWGKYYNTIFYPESFQNSTTYTKIQYIAHNITVNDTISAYSTRYDYNTSGFNWTWHDKDIVYYTPRIRVTNAKGDQVLKYYNVFDTEDDLDEYPLYGVLNATLITDHALGDLKSINTTYDYYEFQDDTTHPRNNIFHLRTTSTNTTMYGTGPFYNNNYSTGTQYTDFNETQCDLPQTIISYGNLTDLTDALHTNKTYISIDNFTCLEESTQTTTNDETLLTQTDTVYHTSDDERKGLPKNVTTKNPRTSSEDRWQTYDYDEYTNLDSISDSYANEIEIVYDSSRHLYLEQHINPLDHKETIARDILFRPNMITSINSEATYIQYDDLNRICRYQGPGRQAPISVQQSEGSAEDICQTQGVHNPPPRELSLPVYIPENPTCDDMTCKYDEWCCDPPPGQNATCISRTQTCPSGIICSPSCNPNEEGCCDPDGDGSHFDPDCVPYESGCSWI